MGGKVIYNVSAEIKVDGKTSNTLGVNIYYTIGKEKD